MVLLIWQVGFFEIHRSEVIVRRPLSDSLVPRRKPAGQKPARWLRKVQGDCCSLKGVLCIEFARAGDGQGRRRQ
jgi:hypothetical protein